MSFPVGDNGLKRYMPIDANDERAPKRARRDALPIAVPAPQPVPQPVPIAQPAPMSLKRKSPDDGFEMPEVPEVKVKKARIFTNKRKLEGGEEEERSAKRLRKTPTEMDLLAELFQKLLRISRCNDKMDFPMPRYQESY